MQRTNFRVIYGLAVATFIISDLAAAEPSAKRGRELYMTIGCVHCHGTMGQGSNAGLKLAPEPLPAEAIAQFIRATNTTMPAYSEHVLNDVDVADIAAFLATIPASKSADEIPALKNLKPGG
ncbi:MAG: cytochrome c [Rhodospirillaceae bacterium]|nr:cytochrome c [Rhodospirillaceae bacterium]